MRGNIKFLSLFAMQPEGTVVCFMCQGFVPYNPENPAKFTKHMKSDHSAFFGVEYLLAGCRMTEEERKTVNEVVGEKELGDGVGDITNLPTEPGTEIFFPMATLEEGELHNDYDARNIKQENVVENPHKCDFCLKSFTVWENLVEHISRKHPTKKPTNKNKRSQPASIPKTTSNGKIPRGLRNKNSKLISNKRRSVNPRRPQQDIPEGEGFPCRECGKIFRTESMEKFHYTDVHEQGYFPCKGGCGKIFTSKNKMSSHWSRHCNPRNKSRMSM